MREREREWEGIDRNQFLSFPSVASRDRSHIETRSFIFSKSPSFILSFSLSFFFKPHADSVSWWVLCVFKSKGKRGKNVRNERLSMRPEEARTSEWEEKNLTVNTASCRLYAIRFSWLVGMSVVLSTQPFVRHLSIFRVNAVFGALLYHCSSPCYCCICQPSRVEG